MFERITINTKQMGGVPCIRGLRIPVATVVGMVADGMSRDEILEAYPGRHGGGDGGRRHEQGRDP